MNTAALLLSTLAVGQCYTVPTVIYDSPVYVAPVYTAPATYVAPVEHHNLINTGTIHTKCYERVRVVSGGRTYYREVPVVNGWLPAMTEHKDSSGRICRIDFDYSERTSYARMKPKGITYRDSSYTPPKPAPKPRTTLADLPEPLTYPSTPKTAPPPLVKIDRGLSSTLADKKTGSTPSDIEFRRLQWDVDDLERTVRTLERNQRSQQQKMSNIETDVSEIRRMLQELIERENRRPPTEVPSPQSKESPKETTLQSVAPGHSPMRYPEIEGSMVAPDKKDEVILPRVN